MMDRSELVAKAFQFEALCRSGRASQQRDDLQDELAPIDMRKVLLDEIEALVLERSTLRDALVRIADWHPEELKDAKTLHFDMKGWAEEALINTGFWTMCPHSTPYFGDASTCADCKESPS